MFWFDDTGTGAGACPTMTTLVAVGRKPHRFSTLRKPLQHRRFAPITAQVLRLDVDLQPTFSQA